MKEVLGFLTANKVFFLLPLKKHSVRHWKQMPSLSKSFSVEKAMHPDHVLTEIGIDEKVASKDAKRMERVVSDEIVSLTAEAIQCKKRRCSHCPIGYPLARA